MAAPIEDTLAHYGNVMDEIRKRLHFVDWALGLPVTDDALEYIAVSDLCLLQFRKIFEAIAIGCLLVHGDLPKTNKLKKDIYRADKLLKALANLDADFYPVPCDLERSEGKIRSRTAIGGNWLTRERLQELYTALDANLHVGTLTRRKLGAEPIKRDALVGIAQLTRRLLHTHRINVAHAGIRIIAELDGPDGVPFVSVQRRKPNPNAGP